MTYPRTSHRTKEKPSASYEVLIDRTVKWRGHKLEQALPRLSRRYPHAHLTIRWLPGPELLVVVDTL